MRTPPHSTSSRPTSSGSANDQHVQTLHDAGLDPTEARLRILSAFPDAPRAVSAPELLEHLRKSGPFDKVTLYRTLDSFAEKGVVQRHNAADRTFRYCVPPEGNNVHGHFFCTQCGAMECLLTNMPPLSATALLDAIAKLGSQLAITTDSPRRNSAPCASSAHTTPQAPSPAAGPGTADRHTRRIDSVELLLSGVCARCLSRK